MNQTASMKNQQGVSYLGIFFAIVLFALAIKIAVAVWPAYWDDRVINSQIEEALSSLPKDTTQNKFKQDLSQRLEMNNIRDLKVDDIMTVTNTAGLAVKKDYEVRKPFLMNIALVMTFQKDFDQRSASTGE
ncbi:protein of unknown function [Acinetobacter marinus]|uniref:DUF4845 domain-containing protein n=2 Tax=Acinetobacter marinus TaxID=281375 RepID=A0A1G6L297_9GAMM|nr:protein of unknown function [Acinetobacter marinus]